MSNMVSPPLSTSSDSDGFSYFDDVRYTDKPIPRISLCNFEARIDSITADIAAAAERHGFFVLTDHSIPQSAIDTEFAAIQRFFKLPDEVKAKTPYSSSCNAGWEQETTFLPPSAEEMATMRPCEQTDRPDDLQKDKETYRMQFSESVMSRRWVADHDLPGFRHQNLTFMHACHGLSVRLMVCLARGLGFTEENGKDDKIFVKAHAMAQPGIQTVLRAQRYYALDQHHQNHTPESRSHSQNRQLSSAPTTPTTPTAAGSPLSSASTQAPQTYRDGSATYANSDPSFLTLRFQRPGQSGLEICPGGRESIAHHSTDAGAEWTKIETTPGEIICNVGDLLMFWSDDRYKSSLFRERAPSDPAVDFYGDCYSLAYFNQPSRDCVLQLQGPQRTKYPATAAGELMDLLRKRNYAKLEEMHKQAESQAKRRQPSRSHSEQSVCKSKMTYEQKIASAAGDPNEDAGTAAAAFAHNMSSYMESSFM